MYTMSSYIVDGMGVRTADRVTVKLLLGSNPSQAPDMPLNAVHVLTWPTIQFNSILYPCSQPSQAD